MPLVRISLLREKGEAFGRKVGEVVYRAMLDAATSDSWGHAGETQELHYLRNKPPNAA